MKPSFFLFACASFFIFSSACAADATPPRPPHSKRTCPDAPERKRNMRRRRISSNLINVVLFNSPDGGEEEEDSDTNQIRLEAELWVRFGTMLGSPLDVANYLLQNPDFLRELTHNDEAYRLHRAICQEVVVTLGQSTRPRGDE